MDLGGVQEQGGSSRNVHQGTERREGGGRGTLMRKKGIGAIVVRECQLEMRGDLRGERADPSQLETGADPRQVGTGANPRQEGITDHHTEIAELGAAWGTGM